MPLRRSENGEIYYDDVPVAACIAILALMYGGDIRNVPTWVLDGYKITSEEIVGTIDDVLRGSRSSIEEVEQFLASNVLAHEDAADTQALLESKRGAEADLQRMADTYRRPPQAARPVIVRTPRSRNHVARSRPRRARVAGVRGPPSGSPDGSSASASASGATC